MKTLLVILSILVAGSTYAANGNPTTSKGCYGIGKIQNLSEISAFMNGNSSVQDDGTQKKETKKAVNPFES